jgi:pimeloyl-ACP methyl ester carboxylesterase
VTSRQVWRVNGVALAVTAVGEGPLVVLAHGFPDLAITWRLQIATLVAAGYRVVAPDMRGYGASERPSDPSSYSTRIIGQDLVGLLDHQSVDKAHFVGHDWGAACVWQLGVDHPDRIRSLSGISVPYVLPAKAPPTRILRARHGDDFYIVRFQDPDANASLDRAPALALSAAFNDRYETFGDENAAAAEEPEWLPPEVFASYVDSFAETGFSGGLNYYRAIDLNWRNELTRGEGRIDCPSLFVTGSLDPVGDFMAIDESTRAFSQLRVEVVQDAGHWVHQQYPVETNHILLTHLRNAEMVASTLSLVPFTQR